MTCLIFTRFTSQFAKHKKPIIGFFCVLAFFMIITVVLNFYVNEILESSQNKQEKLTGYKYTLVHYKDFIFYIFALILYIADTSGLIERFTKSPNFLRAFTLVIIAVPSLWVTYDAFNFTNPINYLLALLLTILCSVAFGLKCSEIAEK